MGFLKGLAISLLSFLLFLSLSIFGLVLMLNQTILNPNFIVTELNKLDVSALAEEFLSEQIPQEVISDTIADLEPWIKEQAGILTYSTYDYITGKSQSLSVAISLEPLKDNLWQAFLESPPPELAAVPQAELEQYFDESYEQLGIPDMFDESFFPTEVQMAMGQARQYVGYFQLGYKLLIVFIVLLIAGIILINRQVRSATRGLGIVFLSFGALEYAGIFIVNRLLGTQLMQLDLPPSLQAWLPQFLGDLLAPLGIFSIGVAVAGVVLIVVSIIYKRKPAV